MTDHHMIHNMGRAIIPYGRSLSSLVIAQSLGAQGVEIIGCDSVDLTALSFSKYVMETEVYTDPHKDESTFIKDIKATIKKHKPVDDNQLYVLMPSIEHTQLFAKYKKEIEAVGIVVATPDPGSIDKIFPKSHLIKTAQDSNVNIPQSTVIAPSEEINDCDISSQLPCFVKPEDDSGGRGVYRTETKEELKERLFELREQYPDQALLVQDDAGGKDYCYCGLYNKGERVIAMAYTNVETFPVESGPGNIRRTLSPDPFFETADTLMKKCQWHGVVEMDFMWDGDDDTSPTLIEVNPRFWSGIDHSIASGINFPWLYFQLLKDGQVSKETLKQQELDIGHQSSKPVTPSLSTIERFMDGLVDGEQIERAWQQVKDNIDQGQWQNAVKTVLKSGVESISLNGAFAALQSSLSAQQHATPLDYNDEDPYVGLGVLYILSHIAKNGKLPKELKR